MTTGGTARPGDGLPCLPGGGEEPAGAVGYRNGQHGGVSAFLREWQVRVEGESCQKPSGVKGLFCDRSDYEEMPLQNGQAIRAQYKEASESD